MQRVRSDRTARAPPRLPRRDASAWRRREPRALDVTTVTLSLPPASFAASISARDDLSGWPGTARTTICESCPTARDRSGRRCRAAAPRPARTSISRHVDEVRVAGLRAVPIRRRDTPRCGADAASPRVSDISPASSRSPTGEWSGVIFSMRAAAQLVQPRVADVADDRAAAARRRRRSARRPCRCHSGRVAASRWISLFAIVIASRTRSATAPVSRSSRVAQHRRARCRPPCRRRPGRRRRRRR